MPLDMHGEPFHAVLSWNGWMVALTWIADGKHEPVELWGARAEHKQNES